ncbi:MAG: type II toxin-antitoxin system VapC family toxin [Thermodesulfobacteriota bacterium]|nr:type II toxin-antitoxin system VapC family toxin [Thermodesulfobacteriota bacterium]
MKYLIDTDIASYYLRGKHNLVEIFKNKGPSDLRLSMITVAQMQVLAYINPHSKINLSNINNLAMRLGVIDIDRRTWGIFSKTKADANKCGKPRGDLDILQASVAKQYGLIVVTHNTEHYKGIVEYEDWTSQ